MLLIVWRGGEICINGCFDPDGNNGQLRSTPNDKWSCLESNNYKFSFFCYIGSIKTAVASPVGSMQDAIWLLCACKSSRWKQWCSTEDWPQNIGKCVWRNPHQCLSATVVLCDIRLSGAYWFICRLLPYACHSPGLRLCVSRRLFIVFWLGILGRKPCHMILHGMCYTKFGISV